MKPGKFKHPGQPRTFIQPEYFSQPGYSVARRLAGLGTLAVLTVALAQGGTIKIGGAFNLTGALSSLDAPAANGAKLAVQEINAAGGVLGRKLELVVYDGKSDAATITNVASQMIGSDKVTAVVGFTFGKR